ncbi:MAG: c-type cytochrome, partial [Pseudobdellovibrionaceae bacterium]
IAFMVSSCSFLFQEGVGELQYGKPSMDLISKVSYQDVMTADFEPKCVSCHGSSGGVNLESYQNAKQFLAQIQQSTMIGKRMPKAPYSPLTNEEMQILAAWIQAGGPDAAQSGIPTEPPPAAALEPTFDSVKSQILDKKCTICHSPGGKAQNIPLLTKDDLLNSPLEIVIPGNPEESMLMLVLREGARKFMPPKASGMTPLTNEQIEIIGSWISDGAK